ncbi:MAG: MoxR family ATPase, partial [Roseiflexaceae bacterium]
IVIITSNRTREVHDALKRRCLFHWVDYPVLEKELKILTVRVPGINAILGRQIVLFVQELRRLDLFKVPGVAETIDWANALAALQTTALTFESVDDTLGAILKYQDDLQQIRGDAVRAILARIGSA